MKPKHTRVLVRTKEQMKKIYGKSGWGMVHHTDKGHTVMITPQSPGFAVAHEFGHIAKGHKGEKGIHRKTYMRHELEASQWAADHWQRPIHPGTQFFDADVNKDAPKRRTKSKLLRKGERKWWLATAAIGTMKRYRAPKREVIHLQKREMRHLGMKPMTDSEEATLRKNLIGYRAKLSRAKKR